MDYRKLWTRFAAAAAALLLLGGLCACSNQPEESSSMVEQQEDLTPLPKRGPSIGGKSIAGKTVEEALEIARSAVQEAVDGLEITVKFPG